MFGSCRHSTASAGVRFGAAFWIQRTDWPDSATPAWPSNAPAGTRSGSTTTLSDEADWADPKLEGWASLAAVSSITTRVRPRPARVVDDVPQPGLIAKLATTLDHQSGGRAVLGLGGGWFEREHDAFGIDFGAGFGERLDRLDEATGVIRRLLDGERVTHDGPSTLCGTRCASRARCRRLPILIGGSGPTKTLRTTARYADLWNGYGDPTGSRRCPTCFARAAMRSAARSNGSNGP